MLNLSDGEQDLRSIAERAGIAFDQIRDAADTLVAAGLLALDLELEVSKTSASV